MALMTCPDCQNQFSDTAPACPRCGWARAALAAASAAHAAASASHTAKLAQAAEGKKLVNLSTGLMVLGFVIAFAGCGVANLTSWTPGITVGLVLGLAVLVVAAVVGQIGRAKQGRII